MSKPVGPYTPIVRAGDWLVVSGQIGAVEGKLVEGGMREQLAQVLKNLRGLLEGEGSSLDQVVKCTVFLTDMSDFAAMNEMYMHAFGDHRTGSERDRGEGAPARRAHRDRGVGLHGVG